MHPIRHFFTIVRHRHAVMRHCFQCGLIWRGLVHDLSKYSLSEFWSGAKYYQGNRSPQSRERELFGYSAAWLHHKGRNKHHFEYWTDFGDGKQVYVDMPPQFFVEMVCDRIAACKIYLKDGYTDRSALDYFENKTDKKGMNRETCERLRYYLTLLAEKGEKETFKALKSYIREKKKKRT